MIKVEKVMKMHVNCFLSPNAIWFPDTLMIPFSLWFVDNLGGYAREMQPVHCFAYHLVNPKPTYFFQNVWNHGPWN